MNNSTNKTLLIVDIQNYTISRLPNHVVQNIMTLLDNKAQFGINTVVATRFINSHNSLYQTQLNWNACTNGSTDIEIPKDVLDKIDYVVHKNTYSIDTRIISNIFKKSSEIYIVGTDIDACIYAIALELFENNIVPKLVIPCIGTAATNQYNSIFETCTQMLCRQIGSHNLIYDINKLKVK